MITYRPTKKIKIRKQVLILTVILFAVGIALITGLKRIAYSNQMQQLQSPEEVVLLPYRDAIQQKTDVNKLATIGGNLLKKGMPLYASLNLKRASDLDPNYRDVAYGWAYAVLQSKENNLSANDLADIKTALERIEGIDPYFLPALQMSKVIAELEGNEQKQQSISKRMELLQ